MSAFGCGRRVTIHLMGGPGDAVHVNCGEYYLGELIQCEECAEKPYVAERAGTFEPVPRADPEDEDAQAEAEAERRFMAGDPIGREGP